MPSAVATVAIAASLKRLYGEIVNVQHHDVDAIDVQQAYPAMLELIQTEGLPIPITVFDNEILFVGGIQPLKVVAAVAERLAHHGIKPRS